MRLAVLVLAVVLAVPVAAQQPPGVTNPVVVKEVKPLYTEKARSARIQRSVYLAAVVQPDGSVGEVAIAKSLDSELDQQAIAALRQWEFKPGTVKGKPVAVTITCELVFRLP